MYIILFLLIIIFSSVLSFITSGFEHIFKSGDSQWYMIPLGYYFLFYSLISYLFYRIKYNNISLFKFSLLRKISKLNKFFHKIDNKVTEKIEINSMQEISIKTWCSLLKDKSTILSANILTHNRVIQKGNLLIVLKQRGDSMMTVMDTNDINIFYEIFIPQKYYEEIGILFDREQDKRMSLFESTKRKELESLINTL